MEIVGIYSFNGGTEYVQQHFAEQFAEVEQVIRTVEAARYKTKTSAEKTMRGKNLYSSRGLNQGFKHAFQQLNWQIDLRIPCAYPAEYYVNRYQPAQSGQGAFRAIDFVKDALGVEVQFGKYAFMVYNVCAKMTIFNKHGFIRAGIEIVPVKEFASEMSTGVSYDDSGH